MTDAGSRLIVELRGYVVAFTEFSVLFAESMHVSATDGAALAEIAWGDRTGAPLSAARLSERIGLTSSATNALVSRLERNGHIVRVRESVDRRVVSLRPTPEAREHVEHFAAKAAPDVQAVLNRIDPEAVGLLADTVAIITNTMHATNLKLRRDRRADS